MKVVALATHRRRLPLRDRVVAWLVLALALQRSRRDLAELSDAGLRDIGLTRAAAAEEGAKPFWR